MKKVGELLRTEREKKGLSLHEIGLSLKINPKILKAIEDGDTSQLPAKTFLRGFIRSYAQYLKLDVESVLNLFSSEFGTTRPEVPVSENDTHSVNTDSASHSASDNNNSTQNTKEPSNVIPLKAVVSNANNSNESEDTVKGLDSKKSVDNLLLFFLGVGLIIFIVLIINQTNKYQKEKETAGTDIESGVVSITTTTLFESALNVNSSTTTTVAANSSAVNSASNTNLSTNSTSSSVNNSSTNAASSQATTTTLKKPSNSTTTTTTLKIKSTTSTLMNTTTTSLLTSTGIVNSISTNLSTTTTTTIPPKTVEVIIEALNKVSIKFATSPGQWQTVDLEADQVHIFKSKTGLDLEISDGGAVSIVVNGKDRGVQGIIGKPLKLKY